MKKDSEIYSKFPAFLVLNAFAALKNTYPKLWPVYTILAWLVSASFSFFAHKHSLAASSQVSFGVASVLGIYISMSISILLQIQAQADRYNLTTHVNLEKTNQELPSQISIKTSIGIKKLTCLKSIFHLVVLSIGVSSAIMVTSLGCALVHGVKRSILFDSSTFLASMLGFTYYLIVRNIYYLFDDDFEFGS